MILILGAGVSGLTAANRLEGKKEFLVLEKSDGIGGLSTQYEAGGYWFDYSGHYFHFQNKEDIKKLVERVCPFKEFKRVSKTFVLNRYVPFPVQFHLSSLPAGVRKKILAEIPENPIPAGDNLYEYLETNFGKTLFELFFHPFLSKYYQMDIREMVADMDKGSIPPPDKARIAAGAEGKKFLDAGYNPVFYYPRSSLRHFIRDYAAPIGAGKIHLNEGVIDVDAGGKKVITEGGEYPYRHLISSIPLNQLVEFPGLRSQLDLPSSKAFKHVSTLLVNVILKRRRRRFHWVYAADRDLPFYRTGFYPLQANPTAYLEKSLLPGSLQRGIDGERVYREMVYTLQKLGVIEKKEEIVFWDAREIPVSYILFSRNWRETVPPVLEKLRTHGIHSIGRYGSWDYTSMSDDIKMAFECTEGLR